MGAVFISYREKIQRVKQSVFQELVVRLGRDSVFMDVDSIALGRTSARSSGASAFVRLDASTYRQGLG